MSESTKNKLSQSFCPAFNDIKHLPKLRDNFYKIVKYEISIFLTLCDSVNGPYDPTCIGSSKIEI